MFAQWTSRQLLRIKVMTGVGVEELASVFAGLYDVWGRLAFNSYDTARFTSLQRQKPHIFNEYFYLYFHIWC